MTWCVAGRPVLRTVLDQVGAATSPSPAVNPQSADVILGARPGRDLRRLSHDLAE